VVEQLPHHAGEREKRRQVLNHYSSLSLASHEDPSTTVRFGLRNHMAREDVKLLAGLAG
jgi:hypothetical protein